MNTTNKQYLNAILRQYHEKLNLLSSKALSISCIYMNNRTRDDLKAIGNFVFYTNEFQMTFCGHPVIIANLLDGIIDVGVDYTDTAFKVVKT